MKNKPLIIIVLIIVLIALKLYISSESHFPFNPYVDTIFSKEFSWEKFKKVSIGMTQNQTKDILGEPLDKPNYGSDDPNRVCWRYSTDGKLAPYADFSWYSVQVCFQNGLVESKPVVEFNN